MPIKDKTPTVVDEGLMYHLTCYYPKGVPNGQNFVGAGVPVFPHDHLPDASS